ncbi:hypothetical protein CYLTODRAFT_412766 [Cylindrobasidium torrendii FP15055 ss-10]|uniref:Uncharacterized protein n=1 Tax=Cylindrobasidium torrendii FP15055 ss-10 TaxID=1314674 RepID=A0A0D7B3T8_9AGAR|nr:hypothetical protein CYLTODRAFT_412766 [Cylindrobasidium torrendii FP15055 ss-10]
MACADSNRLSKRSGPSTTSSSSPTTRARSFSNPFSRSRRPATAPSSNAPLNPHTLFARSERPSTSELRPSEARARPSQSPPRERKSMLPTPQHRRNGEATNAPSSSTRLVPEGIPTPALPRRSMSAAVEKPKNPAPTHRTASATVTSKLSVPHEIRHSSSSKSLSATRASSSSHSPANLGAPAATSRTVSPSSSGSRRVEPSTSISPALDALPQRLAVEDMKRLMSKPASVLSGSDSEGYRSLGQPGSIGRNPNARRQTVLVGPLHSDDDMLGSGGYRSSPAPTSPSVIAGASKVKTKTKPTPYSDTEASAPLSRIPSAERKRLKRRPSQEQKAAQIVPPSYNKAKPSTSRSHEPTPDSNGVTPATALALAYKQRLLDAEERERRESLAQGRNPDPLLVSPAAPDDPQAPYYTVLGSRSGKVVAVGGPEDSWTEVSLGAGFAQTLGQGLGLDTITSTVTTGVKSRASMQNIKSPSNSISKTLGRKVSQRWRKGSFNADDWQMAEVPAPVEGPLPEEPEPVHEQEQEQERGRPNLQERRKSTGRKSTAPVAGLRVSVSGSPKAAEGSPKTPQTATTPMLTPKDADGPHTLPRTRKADTLGPANNGNSSKLWKLMKRISTGGLREKYTSDEAAPPVPSVPKELISGPLSADGHGSSQRSSVLEKFTQSRPSMNASQSSPSRLPLATSPLVQSSPTRNAEPSVPQSGVRQSTTTRSSSPVSSSDVASSRFFNRTLSQRSSTSSYGEEVPPIPNTRLGQHIVPPHELYKFSSPKASSSSLGTNGSGGSKAQSLRSGGTSRSSSKTRTQRSTSSPEKYTASTEDMSIDPPSLPSLPVPPRRLLNKLTKPAPSPTIPAFSIESPINTFVRKKQSIDLEAVSPPPPRPSRSPRRPSGSSPAPTLPPLALSTPQSSPAPIQKPSYESKNSLDLKRSSTTSHSTVTPSRPRSFASTLGAGTFGSTSGVAMKAQFREKPSPRAAMSEREKADMWDDLLERSARAGGTLHLKGADALASDEMRFSATSTDFWSDGE